MYPHISIIVPIFNTADYIKDCLESIKRQTYENWSCILVDDGSTDRSGFLCDQYTKNDKRFIVYHIQNSGEGGARNFGLSKANGDFITFIDSDDWIDENYLEFLISKITEDTDIVMCHSIFEYPQKAIDVLKINPKTIVFSKKDKKNLILSSINRGYSKKQLHQEQGSLNTVWGKLYRFSVIKENELKFTNSKLNEDMLFNLFTFQYSRSIKIFDETLYHYRIRSTSAVRTFRTDYIDVYKTFLGQVNSFINLFYKKDGEIEANYYSLALTSLFNILKDYFYNENYKDKKKKKKEMKLLSNSDTFLTALNYKHLYIKNNEVGFISFAYKHNLYSLIGMYFSLRKTIKSILISTGSSN